MSNKEIYQEQQQREAERRLQYQEQQREAERQREAQNLLFNNI
jgi:hypothetical protein